MVFTSSTTAREAAELFKDEIKGKNVIVTGVSLGGIGHITAEEIAKYAALVVLAGRSQSKLQEAQQAILKQVPIASLRLLTIDFNAPDSVRRAANEVNTYPEPIDCLINNAGIMNLPNREESGWPNYEKQFAVNHLSPFLFTNLIKPRLAASAAPRIVNVASTAHAYHPVNFEDPGWNKRYNSLDGYGESKTANMLFALSLSRKWKDINATAYSLHPGFIRTNLQQHSSLGDNFAGLWRHLCAGLMEGLKSTQQGAATSVIAAFDPSIKEQSGSYLWNGNVRPDRAKDYAKDPQLAEKLWKLSEEIVGQKFD